MLAMTEKGLSREDAYALVQRNALDAFNNHGDFKKNLLADKDVTNIMNNEEIEKCFDSEYYLRNISQIYERFEI